jgi:hypothetical protein
MLEKPLSSESLALRVGDDDEELLEEHVEVLSCWCIRGEM